MNTRKLAEDFLALPAVTGLPRRHELSEVKEDTSVFPAAIVSAECAPFSANGRAGRFTLTHTVHSDAETTTAAAHEALVVLQRAALLDSIAANLALLNARGIFSYRGYSAGTDAESFSGNSFVTPIVITGTTIEL